MINSNNNDNNVNGSSVDDNNNGTVRDKNFYTTTDKCLQCLIEIMYTVF